MLAAVAIPASMMTSAPFGAVRPLIMSASVALSATLPANIERRTETAAIEHESESDERAIGALLL